MVDKRLVNGKLFENGKPLGYVFLCQVTYLQACFSKTLRKEADSSIHFKFPTHVNLLRGLKHQLSVCLRQINYVLYQANNESDK